MNEREPTERWKATEQTDSSRMTTRWKWPTTTTPAVSTTRLQGVQDTPQQVTRKAEQKRHRYMSPNAGGRGGGGVAGLGQ
jgi:hypothetical protein